MEDTMKDISKNFPLTKNVKVIEIVDTPIFMEEIDARVSLKWKTSTYWYW